MDFATAQRTSIHEQLADVPSVECGSNHQEHGADDDDEGRVAPTVASDESGPESEHSEPNHRFAIAVALDAGTASALLRGRRRVRRPGVEHDPDAQHRDQDAYDERKSLDAH